jgi:predicted dehydrogenase
MTEAERDAGGTPGRSSGRPPRIGVAGTGWWASTAHLPSLARYAGAELVAVCDPVGERAREAAGQFGIPHVFVDVADLLAADLLDGLVVATPHTTHHAVARAALDAGVHVLVEKPLATTAADAWDLAEAAERAGRHLAVGYTYQHTSTAAFVRHAVREEIGELVCVAAEFASGTQGLFTGGADPADASQPHPMTYADPRQSGGGQGHTQVTHLMGMVGWVTNRVVEEVFCYLDRRGLAVDLVDVMAFRFAGGSSGTVTSTGTAVGGQPAHQRIRYYGTAGCVEQDLVTAQAVVHRNDGTRTTCQLDHDAVAYPVQAPARHFADLIAGAGDADPAPGIAAAATVAFLDAAYRSAASHRPERVANRH